ncbi:MAG: hypothetical protein Q9206_005518 [Seirophora lacunosa]
MARLNEPSTQVESVEAQSEISRLLSENLSLREQVIKLQCEIDHNVRADSINTVRCRLETKLGELGSLVQELGSLRRNAEDRRAIRRRSGVQVSPKKSPDQRNWKNGLTISEVMGGADGRLPPIVEGKHYPRRTLDVEELLGALSDSDDLADSPDLGPPPIAHFEAGDPIKFEASHHGSPRKERSESAGLLNPALLANLETRRKRRESSRQGEIDSSGTKDFPATILELLRDTDSPEHTLKSGAKRKFGAREDNEQPEMHGTSKKDDDFEYNRILEHHAERSEPGISQPEKQAEQDTNHETAKIKERSRGRPKINANPSVSSRNVLAPKSVNTDPVSSPVKMNRLATGDKAGPLKPDKISKPRDRSRARDQPASQRFARPAKAPQAEVPEPRAGTTIGEQAPPSRLPAKSLAPAPPDPCSPDDCEPPTARAESRDTPPPADLDPEMANTHAFGSLGRASRRQKGSVSYVEPNLRDKMRRPTKELVDAVGAEERMRQKKASKGEADATEAESTGTGEAPSMMRTVTIKKEPTADDGLDWRALAMKRSEDGPDRIRAEAPSPLRNKVPIVKADLPPSVATERRRRPSMLERDKAMGDGAQQGSTAASTVAAVMTDPKHRSRENSAQVHKPKQASRPSEKPEIYDLQGNSPAETDDGTAKARELKPVISRSSRRHSSVSDDRIKDAVTRRAERRKETAAVPDLKNVRSAATLAIETGEGAQGRGERAAANRRRSMML